MTHDMKNPKISDDDSSESDKLQAEYQFDYRKARPNRFAERVDAPQIEVKDAVRESIPEPRRGLSS